MAKNIISAVFSSSNITYTKPAYQYDYGMILKFSGIELPQAYEVHFSNTEFCGESISQIGDESGVTIPDEMFLSGAPIYAWTFLHTGEDDGETVYKTVISINKRAQPSDIEPTPVQQDVITQAIAALNTAVEQTAADVVAAGESAEAAAGSAEAAGQAKDDAVEAKDKAVEAKNAAETAQGKAEDAQRAAEQAAGSVLGLTADATVDANVGTPSVEVEVTTESDHKKMSFAFHNLKGVQGDPGDTGVGISSVVLNADYTLTIILTNGTSYTTTSIRGEVGATPNLTIGTISTLPEGSQATATITGTSENPVLNLGIPVGDTGDPGISPTITVTEITGGHEVEVVDAEGTQTFDVMDGEVSEEELETALIDKADVITSSASGEIVTIQDGAKNLPVVDLSLSLLPVQDLHGYDNPWPAGGGTNMLSDQNGTYTEKTSGNMYFVNGMTLPAGTYYVGRYKKESSTESTGIYLKIGSGTASRLGQNEGQKYIARSFTLEEESSVSLYLSSSVTGGYYRFMLSKSVLTNGQDEFAPYSNICSISGWTGVEVYQAKKNLLNVDNVASIYSTATNQRNGIYFAKPGTYTIRANVKNSDVYISSRVKTADGTYGTATTLVNNGSGSTATYTLNKGDTLIVFDALDNHSIATTKQLFTDAKIQLEVGSTDTEYEAFNGTTYPISWQSSAGTVYGCNIKPVSGLLTVDKVIYEYDGSEDESWSNSFRSSMFYTPNPVKASQTITMNLFKGLAPMAYTSIPEYCGAMTVSPHNYINIHCPMFTTVANFRAYLANNPLQIMFTPQTPTTYQLTPVQIATLLGTNNFWSNSNGSIDLEYRADTKLYIEQLTKPSEDDMTANANITSGSFFMVGNRLFLSTVAIGQGEAIVPGTNCSEVSLADALNSINS